MHSVLVCHHSIATTRHHRSFNTDSRALEPSFYYSQFGVHVITFSRSCKALAPVVTSEGYVATTRTGIWDCSFLHGGEVFSPRRPVVYTAALYVECRAGVAPLGKTELLLLLSCRVFRGSYLVYLVFVVYLLYN